MSFESVETSKERGRPYELYRFQYGPSEIDSYKYTNSVTDIGDFKAIPINRDSYKTTGKAERDQQNITMPVTTDLAKLLLPYPTPIPVEITIWQGHHGEPEQMVVWVGRILSNAYKGNEIALTCESTLISLKRQGLRRRYQLGCPFVLYGPDCKVDRAAFTRDAEIIDIQNGVPQFNAGWNGTFPIAKFVGGVLRWQSTHGVEYRSIRAATAGSVTFNGALRDLEIGMIVQLILGCNHRMADCRDVFDNILNFGGQPWIPLQNPTKHSNFW